MKIETRYVYGLNRELTFYIGKNQNDNFTVIDRGSPDDLWFHASDESSCHVVCIIPEDIDYKKQFRYIVKYGAHMCKINTNKLKNQKNVKIMYTEIKKCTNQLDIRTNAR